MSAEALATRKNAVDKTSTAPTAPAKMTPSTLPNSGILSSSVTT
jgi:hypothetical protein